MDVAIIGLVQSGKTTVFNALTGGTPTGSVRQGEPKVGVAKVPDGRLHVLAQMYNNKKIVQAEVRYWDLPGPESATGRLDIEGKHRNTLQGADAFLLVVRAFNDPAIIHPLGSLDAKRDFNTVLEEVAFADLESLDRACDRLEDGLRKSKPTERPAMERQLQVVRKAKEGIEDGVPMREQQLSISEKALLTNYQLLTAKPVIVIVNTSESPEDDSPAELRSSIAPTGMGEVRICAKIEADLAGMSPEDASEFRRELDLGDPAADQAIAATYKTLGLVSFLTVGDDEIRAWSVPHGLPAQQAAGTVHSDFVRGFIRAEVIPFDDLVRCGGIPQGRKEGLLRSEGKTYGVQDGDVIDFLVNT
jgi:GTP-binding protein YchF